MARQLASEITVKGSSLHELLGREVELRVSKFCKGNIKNGFGKLLEKQGFMLHIQPVFTCSKSTMGTQEQCVKSV